MSTPSRFNRTQNLDADTQAQNSETNAGSIVTDQKAFQAKTSQSALEAKDLHQLQERLTKVQRERAQREFELNATQKTIQECEEAALKLGIKSLEEMEEYVRRLEAEDIAAQERFAQELEAEEALLQRISQQLADLERE